MRSASDGSFGAGEDQHAAVVGDHVLGDVGLEVDLVDVLAGEGVGDGEAGPEPEGGRHLTELQVEVDDARALPRVLVQEVRQVGGVEGLPAAAGGGGDGEDRAVLAVGLGRRQGRRVRAAGPADRHRPLDRVVQHPVRDRELEQVEGACPHDVPQLGVGPLLEGQDQRHVRRLVVDRLDAGQARLGAEAGPGDHDVERTAGGDDVAQGWRPCRRAPPRGGDEGPPPPRGPGQPGPRPSRPRGSWGCAWGSPTGPWRASRGLVPGVSPAGGASLATREK